jgi:hypothetical protein
MNLEHVVMPGPQRPPAMMEVADWPEKRVEMMAAAARRVLQLGYTGRVLERGGLSSFCIPDRNIEEVKIWNRRDATPRSSYYHSLLRDERRSFEIHARSKGCDLLINPEGVISSNDTNAPISHHVREAQICRLEILLEFLSTLTDSQCRVVCHDRAGDANITIIKDWFCAETSYREPKQGWRQTVFHWHGPTVLAAQRHFELEFEERLRTFAPDGASSLEIAIGRIKETLRKLEQQRSMSHTGSKKQQRRQKPQSPAKSKRERK